MIEHPHTKSRYPGIRAFEKNERHVFFGRRTEAKKLFNLVKAKPLVVLFAKSGIGKSSLINAGLEPLLESDYYAVVKIRLQSTDISSVEMVKNELKPFLNEAKLKAHTKGNPGFWEYLRACEFKKGTETVTPVLVFDQFEEFFEHNKNDQDELNLELADMVSDRLPERLRDSLRAIPFRDRSKEELDWHSPIPVKFIFAIRSDRMSLMDEMSIKIPSILHNRFHLKPLDIASAREAIIEPARLQEEGFDTLPFTYDAPALQTILEYLKNKNDEIESFQLQLLCRNIERTVQRKNVENIVVSESDFGGASGIKSILNNYYEQEVLELEKEERPLARKFIEEGLIVAGRRVGVSEGVEQKSFGIHRKLLEKLLASRLIRAENTHLGRSFELSHDTLVAPILQSYDIRRREEEKLEAIEKQKEQEQLLASERKKRNRAVLLAAAGFILFLIAAAGGFFAALQWQKAKALQVQAEEAKVIAVEARDRAKDALAQVETAQIEMAKANLENGRANISLGNYQVAIQNFTAVDELKASISDSIVTQNKAVFEEAVILRKKALESGGVKKQYDDYMALGNSALRDQKYSVALSNFKEARKLEASSTANREADLRIEEVTSPLIVSFKDELRKANTFIVAGNCQIAKQRIRKAESLKSLIPDSKIKQEIIVLNRLKLLCQKD
jgi:conflict system STAND superfamily ATPase